MGATLASFNTQREMRTVMELVWSRRKSFSLFIGIHSTRQDMPIMYQNEIFLGDSTVGYHLHRYNLENSQKPFCGCLSELTHTEVTFISCSKSIHFGYLCEFDQPVSHITPVDKQLVMASLSLQWQSHWNSSSVNSPSMVTCPKGHVTHTFLACDLSSDCYLEQSEGHSGHDGVTCSAPLHPLPPSFACRETGHHVSYTLVCDHRHDCFDGSDEDFCVFLNEGDMHGEFHCMANSTAPCGRTQECFPLGNWCDEREDCVNGEDEAVCEGSVSSCHENRPVFRRPPPAVVHFDGYGGLQIQAMSRELVAINKVGCSESRFGDPPSSDFEPLSNKHKDDTECPETHFQCLNNGYCLPVFLRCNGVYDCPGKEDEGQCEDYTCPGHYHCRGSKVCLHPFFVCDGKFQCPLKDDELLCEMSCPKQCVCRGLALTCGEPLNLPFVHPEMRYLDASGSGVHPAHLAGSRTLIHMDLSHCGLSEVGILRFPNMISLDLSHNLLTNITANQLQFVMNLRHLILSSNPFTSFFALQSPGYQGFDSLQSLDLSNVTLPVLDANMFHLFTNVKVLNLSSSGLQRVVGTGFQPLKRLHTIDLNGCPVSTYTTNIFRGLNELHSVYVDNYRLCCPQVLPFDFNINHCHGPRDIVSSCDSLLESPLYKALFAVLTISVLVSDALAMVVWVCVIGGQHKYSFHVFLVHMTVCDVLMGTHTAIVTVADQVYRGHYLWEDAAWRRSTMCQVSRFVFFLSTDVSAFLTCLMTLDRCAALRFPHRYIRVSTRAIHVCCLTVWAGCVFLAAFSLIPRTPHRELNSQTGVCQPLTALLTDPKNHDYTLGALVVLPFALLVIATVGQLYVAKVVREQTNIMDLLQTKHAQFDVLCLSRRVLKLIMYDTLCFLCLCISMVLAPAGVSVSSNVQVGTALLAMPLKSALNPCMYLIGHVQEHHRQIERKRLFKRLG